MVSTNGNILDYSTSRPPVSLLQSHGIVTVSRYLSWLPNPKVILSPEVSSLLNGGIDLFLNWEYRATDELGDSISAGIQATEAVRQAKGLGYPKGATLYFSADFDETPAQAATVATYAHTAGPIVRAAGYRYGTYGGYWVIKRLFDAGLIDDGWQAYAWSGGMWDPRANMRQIYNGYPFFGYDVDLNQKVGPTYSWLHPYQSTPNPVPVPVRKDSDMFAFKQVTSATVYVSDGITYRGLTDWSDFVYLVNSGALGMPAGADPNNRSGWITVIADDHSLDAVGGRLDARPATATVDIPALASAIAADLPHATLDATTVQAAVTAALLNVNATFTTKS